MTPPARRRGAHCSACGTAYAPAQPWPRACASCGDVAYRNPIPVAVLLVPVDDGLVAIRRGIEPQRGALALPGGYVGVGESWQAAAARELLEETSITTDPAAIRELAVHSTPDGALVLLFALAAPATAADVARFAPTDETTECVILRGPTELAFALHTRVVSEYFARR